MNCPACTAGTRVLESRSASGGTAVRRRRVCSACGRRFTTFERLVAEPVLVSKRGGRLEPFDREKLRRALLGAAHKRPVTTGDVDRVVDRIEARVGVDGGEVPAGRLGELALAELADLDYGAYLQFAGTMPDVNPEFAMSPATGSVRVKEDRP